MAFSYNFRNTAEYETENREYASNSTPFKIKLNRTTLQIIAGSILMAALLIGSWSLDYLFMNELLGISFIWGLLCLIRLKTEPNTSSYEKR
jgi:hypothetical protein